MEKFSAYEPVEQQDDHSRSSVDDEQVGFLFHRQRGKSISRFRLLCGTVGVLVFIAYSTLLVVWTRNSVKDNKRYGTRLSSSQSPPDDFIMYEYRQMEQWEGGPDEADSLGYFTSPPTQQVDKNWHDLLEHQNIALPAEVMKQLGREDEGIKLPDGTYYGSLMKNIYHALNPEYYGLVGKTDEEKDTWKDHTNHCLHLLREAIMCQGDTTLISMMFADYTLRPIGNFTSPHECVNWPRLMEWVEPNSRDLTKEGWLIHPKFGPVVVDGHLGNGPI